MRPKFLRIIRRPILWILDRLESCLRWCHRADTKRELDSYEVGKLAWEIRKLHAEIEAA